MVPDDSTLLDSRPSRSSSAVLATLAASAALALTAGALIPLHFFVLTHLGIRLDPGPLFVCLFFFRYWRFIVHAVSGLLFVSAPKRSRPRYNSKDVTVIVPTVEPESIIFQRCIKAIAQNSPAHVMIVTVGQELDILAQHSLGLTVLPQHSDVLFQVLHTDYPNKRHQLAKAIEAVETPIVFFVDATVLWPAKFLSETLPAFEDSRVGIVGTTKQVIVQSKPTLLQTFANFLGCAYLERHNFDMKGSTNVDGGIFTVSGRTCGLPTRIVQDPDFLQAFRNEYFLGVSFFGPLKPDNDSFITRWVWSKGLKVRIQSTPGATIQTPLGEFPKFYQQCLRWSRTTWRNSVTLLLTRRTWETQPWSVYAVYISQMFNFALVIDPLLVHFFLEASHRRQGTDHRGLCALLCWMFFTKVYKLIPHFRRHPGHLVFLPGYLVWGYLHSFIKLWGLITFWDGSWSGRNLKAFEAHESKKLHRD